MQQANPFRSVRPSRREAKGKVKEFKDSIQFLKDLGLEVSITLNSLFPHVGNNIKRNIFDDDTAFVELIEYIKSMHDFVDYWIVSHPHVIELMHSAISFDTKITISTIMNVNRLSQVNWIKKNWPRVRRICPAIDRNRDLAWIARANRLIPMEVLANEFCSIGGIPCEGLYRQACYNSQSLNVRGWNPMTSRCIHSRDADQSSWISARVILPQWLRSYQSVTGVKQFKVSGRTHKAAFIRYIGKAYCRGVATGSIRQLWGQLQATLPGVDKKKAHHKAIDEAPCIPIERVADFFRTLMICKLDECRLTCFKCKDVYDQIMELPSGK
jgi:collagenase-like PrtC family protease